MTLQRTQPWTLGFAVQQLGKDCLRFVGVESQSFGNEKDKASNLFFPRQSMMMKYATVSTDIRHVGNSNLGLLEDINHRAGQRAPKANAKRNRVLENL